MKSKKLVNSLVSLTMVVLMIATCVVTASAAYFTWELTDTDVVYGETGALWWKKTISKQILQSYVYENLDDQKAARAVCDHYTYNSDSDSYTYGWKNDSECYSRARIETVSGSVVLDSGRDYAQYQSYAETNDVAVGVAHTYCGNDAAN